MNVSMTSEELGERLKGKVVADSLDDLFEQAMQWLDEHGDTLTGKAVESCYGLSAAGTSGADNIRAGQTCLTAASTFDDMRRLDQQMYNETIGFMLMFVEAGVYRT